MMTLDLALFRLTANAETIAALTRGLTDAQYRWKPTPDEWSLLEVLCHLYDEEREDFRTRVRLTLENPAADWPPIHPSDWVTERAYNAQDPAQKLEAWLAERRASLDWLRGLQNPNWQSTHTRPQFGSASAGQMLGAWVAHDHLHIRQLNQLHWQRLAQTADPFSLEYAGGW
jgi:hypothetical protein